MSARGLEDPQLKQETLARLQGMRPDSMRLWGRMTPGQMVCHLNDSFLGMMGDKAAVVPGFSFWRLMKGVALYGPGKWPQGVKTRPEFEQGIGGTPPAEFEADVKALQSTIERFSLTPRAFEFSPHPMFGRMTDREWMRWGYLHCDHHLRQFGQ